jgi:hypothetical protein
LAAAVKIDDSDALPSADEATKPIEASDKVSAINFFMIFSLSRKITGRDHHVFITSGRRVALLSKTPVQSKGLQIRLSLGLETLVGKRQLKMKIR